MNKNLKKLIPHFIIIVVSIIIAFPIFKMNLSSTNEFRIHLGRISAVIRLIKLGLFPTLISNNNMDGFGYALNVFYGPITTYIPILLSHKMIATTGIQTFTLISIITSAYTMYFYVLKISENKVSATISAIIYILLPYKLTNIYSRNALGEYSASIFLPLLLNGLYELTYGNYKKKSYLITISAIGLILTHTITTIYITLFSISYLIVFYKKLNKDKLKILAINLSIIFFTTAFYWIPLIEYKINANYVIFDQEMMGTSPRDVYNNTADLNSLFDNELEYKDSDGNSYPTLSLGIISVFLLLSSIICYNNLEENKKPIYKLFIIYSLISIFMSTKLFPWLIMPNILTIIQFAWRMIGFYVLFSSIICGINASIIFKHKEKLGDIFIYLIIIAQLLLSSLYVKNYINKYYNINDEYNYQHSLTSNKLSPFAINREYLPKKVNLNIEYLENRTEKPIILKGNAEITDFKKSYETGESTFNIKQESQNTQIELPYIYYPSYKITDENNNIIKFNESEHGFIEISLTKSSKITIKPQLTKVEKISYGISIIGIILLITNILLNKKERK